MDIFANLNDKQKEAVTAVLGPVLVVAGAGSGKTRALTHRIAYLIKEKGVKPWNILAVTFTNKAAGEMQERVANLLGRNATPSLSKGDIFHHDIQHNFPLIGTFHALCVRILRKHIHLLDFENNFTIYDDADQMIVMKRLLKEQGFSEKELAPRAVLAHISMAKNQLITPEKFQSMADSHFASKVALLYPAYQKALKAHNALDFDDLIMKTCELFEKFKSVLDFYQEKFLYISVDEYQDTNYAQYVLTNLLAKKYRNLCVIGDSDQSIYSWRGANIQNILDFEKDYPDAKIIKLEQNYRSTQPILDCAHCIIVKNKLRKEKFLWTERQGGDPPRLFAAQNERHEAEIIAKEILEALKGYEYPDYRDFTVLYRINAQSRVIEEVFMRYGIPYKIVGGIRFYERKEIKDMLAYLRVIQNPTDIVSLTRIINVPQRNIGPKTLEHLQKLANIKQISVFEAMCRADEISELPDAKKEIITKFAKMIFKLQKINKEFPASGIIKHILENTGYKKFLDDGTIEGESRLENVKELISVASKYKNLPPALSLNIFLEEVSLLTDIDNLDEKENAVVLMTLHSAKGLEFPYVFICGLEEGLLPHSRSMLDPQELEEERRLFYVGLTRAMDKLYLFYARSRLLYGDYQTTVLSQFLLDIPEELLIKEDEFGNQFGLHQPLTLDKKTRPVPEEEGGEFFDGDKVSHAMWGEGIVINIVGGIITVAFKDPKIGVKKLAMNIAPLVKM